MKIEQVNIKNFRSIEEITFKFNPTCRVLVGINESGKSNILKALSLLGDSYKPEKLRDQREALPDEDIVEKSFVKFIFEFEKKELDEIFTILSSYIISDEENPEIVSLNGQNQSVKGFCNTQNKGLYQVDILNENKNCNYYKLEDGFNLLNGWMKPSKNCPADYQLKLKDKAYLLSKWPLIKLKDWSDLPEDYLEDATLQDLEKLVGGIISDITKRNLPKIIFWEYKEENLLPRSVDIDGFANNPDSCIPLKNMFTLSGIRNISEDIMSKKGYSSNQFQNYLDGIARKTTSHFREVWKEYKNIEFSLKKDSDLIIPGIKERNIYDFDKRSDGFKRFITFLLMISTRVRTNLLENTLILVDEAEINLHPSGARYLRDELIKIANKNYVLYSTHSIFMIDSSDIDRHYIVKKENEITNISQAEESNITEEELLYNALGFSTFDFLKEKNIIFEGWRDKFLFQKYLEQQTEEIKEKFKEIGFCHVKGVKNIKTITPLIELAKRKCLIISDSDETAKQYKKQHKKQKIFGSWKNYQDIDSKIKAVTGEDFIKNNFIVEQVNKVLNDKDIRDLKFDKNILKERNNIKNIKNWLKQKKQIDLDKEIDDIIKQTKNLIFENLKYENIEDEYNKLLQGILKYFENQD